MCSNDLSPIFQHLCTSSPRRCKVNTYTAKKHTHHELNICGNHKHSPILPFHPITPRHLSFRSARWFLPLGLRGSDSEAISHKNVLHISISLALLGFHSPLSRSVRRLLLSLAEEGMIKQQRIEDHPRRNHPDVDPLASWSHKSRVRGDDAAACFCPVSSHSGGIGERKGNRSSIIHPQSSAGDGKLFVEANFRTRK